jgi:hypothetical protein
MREVLGAIVGNDDLCVHFKPGDGSAGLVDNY